jgi:hypothetical protein
LWANEHVGGLDVPVNETEIMQERERAQRFCRDIQQTWRVGSAAPRQGEVLSVYVLESELRTPSRGIDLEIVNLY